LPPPWRPRSLPRDGLAPHVWWAILKLPAPTWEWPWWWAHCRLSWSAVSAIGCGAAIR